MQIRETSSLPTLSKPRVTELMRKGLDEYFDLKKNVNRKETVNFKKKLTMFHESIGSLFDISTCKCTNFATCACPREKKIPFQEQQFLSDQRFARKVYIGSIDSAIMKKKKHFKGKWKIKGTLQLKLFFLSILQMVLNHLPTSESSEEFDSDFENSIPLKFKQPILISKPLPKYLPNFAAACDRTGVACRIYR